MAIYKDSVGISISLTLDASISLVNLVVSAWLCKPDGSRIGVTPTMNGHQVIYNTVAGDLDQVGEYSFLCQLKYTDTGVITSTDPLFFNVWPTDRLGHE